MAPHKKTLRELATPGNGNPSQLGDPVSLKAETADSEPTDADRGAGASAKGERRDFEELKKGDKGPAPTPTEEDMGDKRKSRSKL